MKLNVISYNMHYPSNILLLEIPLILAVLIDKVQGNLTNLANFLLLWKNIVKCRVKLVTKCNADVIL